MTNPNNVGLLFGALIGGWHPCWALFVLLGWAQRIFDFIFWGQMIQPVYVIKPFDPLAAITLIAVTVVIGYVFGFVAVVIWNKLHRQ
jgi:hypothetical protein